MIARFSPDSRQLAVILEGAKSTEPVRLLDPNTMQPTTKLDFPGRKPVWGVDVQFSADGRYLAATVQTGEWAGQDISDVPGYAVVWDLRSPSTPPIRVPTGTDIQGMALSPDGQTLYTGLAVDGVRRGDGQADLEARGRQHVVHDSRRERRGDPAGTPDGDPRGRTCSW